jgi:hypothetical protein
MPGRGYRAASTPYASNSLPMCMMWQPMSIASGWLDAFFGVQWHIDFLAGRSRRGRRGGCGGMGRQGSPRVRPHLPGHRIHRQVPRATRRRQARDPLR